MPFETLIAKPNIISPVEFFWPFPNVSFTQTVFAGVIEQGANVGILSTINPSVWGIFTGAGGQQILTIRDVLTFQFLTPFQRAIDASLVFPVGLFDGGAYPVGFELPEWIRVQIFDIWMMLSDDVQAAGDDTGLIFQGNNAGFPWPTFSGNASFGVTADVLNGGWNYINVATGGLYPANIAERIVLQPLGVPLDRSVLTKFTFQFISSSVGRGANLTLSVNDTPIVIRAWVGAGSLLPPYVGNETQWRPVLRVNDGTLDLHVAYMRWRYSKFTTEGIEVRF